MQYTEDQKKAIEARHRNILVAAAAGSGKTRVLVDRIIAQLLARECSVDEMLVVTFTNAAATEMRERIDKALQQKLLETDDRATAEWLERQIVLLSGASICTFHAFCQKVIRQNIDAIDPAIDKLNAALQTAAQDIYNAQQQAGGAQQGAGFDPNAGAQQGGNANNNGDTVQDADFEEVK